MVASEVRNLAQRSAVAAKEIESLISDSVTRVEAGSALVDQSGATLQDIVGSVKKVTDLIAEIAAAASQETSGIDQVNRAVTQMDQIVQANAAQTEELSSTTAALAHQADQLRALVARFNLGDDEPVPTGRVRAVTKPVRPAQRPRPDHGATSHDDVELVSRF